jgi:hypothetical protein
MAHIAHIYLTLEQFHRRLDRRGWETAGKGCYGIARYKGDIVWKTQANTQDGWARFIKDVARGLLSGKHLPRVKLLVMFRDGGIGALMERLTETVHRRHPQGSPETVVRSIARASGRPGERRGLLANMAMYVYERKHGYAALERVFDRAGSRAAGKQEILKRSGVSVLIKEARSGGASASFVHDCRKVGAWAIPLLAEGHLGHWDLHTDNMMYRRDGTLVILDPVT